MTPSEAILKYAKDHHKHIENRLGLCDPSQGDRCDITAAYRHAAQIAEATPVTADTCATCGHAESWHFQTEAPDSGLGTPCMGFPRGDRSSRTARPCPCTAYVAPPAPTTIRALGDESSVTAEGVADLLFGEKEEES